MDRFDVFPTGTGPITTVEAANEQHVREWVTANGVSLGDVEIKVATVDTQPHVRLDARGREMWRSWS